MSGWGDLGAILSGGVKREAEQEYLPQLNKNFSSYKALEEAKIARSQALARERLESSGRAAGVTPFALDTMLSNNTVDFRNAGDAGNPHYFDAQKAAFASAQAGNVDALNPMLAFLEGKPVAVQDSLGGNAYTTNKYSTKGEVKLTPLGDTLVGLNQSKIGTEQSRQQANAALVGQREAAAEAKRNPPAKPTSKSEWVKTKTVNGKKYGKNAKGDWYEIK